jgi:hypothetical protein
MTQQKNPKSFLCRVSQDERELAKYGPSPFVGLNLVLENFESGKNDNKNVVSDVNDESDKDFNVDIQSDNEFNNYNDDFNDESDKDFNDDNVNSSNRIVRKGDRVWIIRQEKEVYRKLVKTN